jgi:hypothetical protein
MLCYYVFKITNIINTSKDERVKEAKGQIALRLAKKRID